MKDLLLILAHLLTTLAKLLGPGGAKAIVADSLLMKQQLLITNRPRRRAPNLTIIDRDQYFGRRSSSAWAKKADALRNISFARFSSRFSRSMARQNTANNVFVDINAECK